jgi:hypothetical protein
VSNHLIFINITLGTCFGQVQHYLTKNIFGNIQGFAWIAHYRIIDQVNIRVLKLQFNMLMIKVENIIAKILLTPSENNTLQVNQLVQYY